MSASFYYDDENAPLPNKPIRIGVCAFIRSEDSLLLELRSDSNRWSLIGGGMEIDEKIEDAMKRELIEETGLTVDTLKFLGVFSNPKRIIAYPDGNIFRIVTFAFEASFHEEEMMPVIRISDESKELRLIKLSELTKYDIVETHKHIIEAYISSNLKVINE